MNHGGLAVFNLSHLNVPLAKILATPGSELLFIVRPQIVIDEVEESRIDEPSGGKKAPAATDDKPQQSHDAQGPILLYEIDPTILKGCMIAAVDKDKLVRAVDRRLNSGAEKLALVRMLDSGRIEVALLRPVDSDRQRVERHLARTGTLEFRILANPGKDKAVIEQAQKEPSKVGVLDPAGKKLAWWVPVRAGEEKSIADNFGIARRTKKQDNREVTEVLVVADPQNVTGAFLTKAKGEIDQVSELPCISFTRQRCRRETFRQADR